MERKLIKGNKTLAETLGVHQNTVQNWRKNGILTKATVSEFGQVIIYDLDKVLDCLNYHPVKRGRRAVI